MCRRRSSDPGAHRSDTVPQRRRFAVRDGGHVDGDPLRTVQRPAPHTQDGGAPLPRITCCRRHGPPCLPGARVLMVEAIVPDGSEPHLAKVVDLTMLGMLTGMERTHAEYESSLNAAGLSLDRVVSTPTPYSIAEATVC
ncbi:methyltransferase [Streptomyces cucumeris]|uniref:methyltransferase n=1 Tax=Streptomyces cucumeris TaxID=2962890 RepID=UPI003EBBEA31